MKSIAFATALLFLGVTAFGQEQRASPKAVAEGPNVKVTYGQPSKKGRVIFGSLEPYGKVWRTGANEATEITFEKDAVFGGKPVKAGTYTLWTIPGEKEWSVILNSDVHFWGTQHEAHKDKDFLTVTVPVKTLSEPIEKLAIRVEPKALVIEWDQTRVAVPMSISK